jgi:hypothetical protein
MTGRVDAVSEDASVFWVILDHGMGRFLIHRTDNVAVRRLPSKKASKAEY